MKKRSPREWDERFDAIGLGACAVPVAAREGGQSEGLLESLGGAEPDGGLGSLSRSEEGDGGDAHDPVLHRRLGIGVDVEVRKLDVDANPQTAMKYGIMSIPTVALFAPGEAPKAAVGFRPAEALEEAFALASFSGGNGNGTGA